MTRGRLMTRWRGRDSGLSAEGAGVELRACSCGGAFGEVAVVALDGADAVAHVAGEFEDLDEPVE